MTEYTVTHANSAVQAEACSVKGTWVGGHPNFGSGSSSCRFGVVEAAAQRWERRRSGDKKRIQVPQAKSSSCCCSQQEQCKVWHHRQPLHNVSYGPILTLHCACSAWFPLMLAALMPCRTNNKKNKREKKEAAKGRQQGDGRCATAEAVAQSKLGVPQFQIRGSSMVCNHVAYLHSTDWKVFVPAGRRNLGKKQVIKRRSPWC